ncbi:MAG: hypothetical protein H6508_06480 [Calditrichaeota bacterium]|nr:hypothetical protein [Calditrichota bacterium]
MYDIHNHVLPSVDDGARGMRQAIRMLESAIHQGITHVLCTPHANDRSNSHANELFQLRFKELKDKIAKLELPIEIGLGSEIMFGMNIQDVLQYPFATLNGTGKYFLIEFPRQTPFEIILNVVKAAKRWKVIPVIAHHERYPLACRSEQQLIQLRTEGAILSIDAGSLVGQFGGAIQKVSREIVATGHIEIMMSDAHDDEKQNFRLAEGRAAAAELIGAPRARETVVDAPRRVWNGEPWPKFEMVKK